LKKGEKRDSKRPKKKQPEQKKNPPPTKKPLALGEENAQRKSGATVKGKVVRDNPRETPDKRREIPFKGGGIPKGVRKKKKGPKEGGGEGGKSSLGPLSGR